VVEHHPAHRHLAPAAIDDTGVHAHDVPPDPRRREPRRPVLDRVRADPDRAEALGDRALRSGCLGDRQRHERQRGERGEQEDRPAHW
jgi:hypothetical protein